jgi:hypothetical protein
MIDKGDGEILVATGSLLILASFFATRFYAARGIQSAGVSNKRLPTWTGRVIFWVVGGFMILAGLNAIFPPR